jgi:dynein heavy chain
LKENFEYLEDPGRDFMTTHDLFIPIMQTILMIWNHSKYYKSPPRLVVLIREICNAIISKAREFASGETIFSLIKVINS